MEPDYFGTEQLTDEDRAYKGSRFSEVRDADKGDLLPKRTLSFYIEVTDEGLTRGLPIFQRRTFKNWRHIGKLTFDNAVISQRRFCDPL